MLIDGSESDAVAAAKIESPHYFAGGGPAVLHALLFPRWGKRGEVCPEDGVRGIPELHAGNAEGSHRLISSSGKHTLRDVHAMIADWEFLVVQVNTRLHARHWSFLEACRPLTTPRSGAPDDVVRFKGCEQNLLNRCLKPRCCASCTTRASCQASTSALLCVIHRSELPVADPIDSMLSPCADSVGLSLWCN